MSGDSEPWVGKYRPEGYDPEATAKAIDAMRASQTTLQDKVRWALPSLQFAATAAADLGAVGADIYIQIDRVIADLTAALNAETEDPR